MSIIAVFNRQDGVGKTTTALNLLAAIAQRGQRPLGIDLDPQAHLSQAFDAHPTLADESVCSFFARKRPLDDIAQITRSGVAMCPAHGELAKLAGELGKGLDVLTRLRVELRGKNGVPGPVVIDCGSPLNALSLNAIFACDVLLVPVASDPPSLQGALDVERALNALEPVLKERRARRYVLTRYDAQRSSAAGPPQGASPPWGVRREATLGGEPAGEGIVQRMAASLRAADTAATRIRESAEIAASAAAGLDVFRHAPASEGAADYRALADELARDGFLA